MFDNSQPLFEYHNLQKAKLRSKTFFVQCISKNTIEINNLMHIKFKYISNSLHNCNNITVHLGQYLSNKVAPLMYNINTKAVSATINMSDARCTKQNIN